MPAEVWLAAVAASEVVAPSEEEAAEEELEAAAASEVAAALAVVSAAPEVVPMATAPVSEAAAPPPEALRLGAVYPSFYRIRRAYKQINAANSLVAMVGRALVVKLWLAPV